jgi:hypothetical protein
MSLVLTSGVLKNGINKIVHPKTTAATTDLITTRLYLFLRKYARYSLFYFSKIISSKSGDDTSYGVGFIFLTVNLKNPVSFT